MQSLNSAKIVVGVHCGKLRTKGMYVQSIMDPAEATFYDQYDAAAYWCSATQTGFGPDGEPVRPDVCNGTRGCCKL
jgi:hypothetical protein